MRTRSALHNNGWKRHSHLKYFQHGCRTVMFSVYLRCFFKVLKIFNPSDTGFSGLQSTRRGQASWPPPPILTFVLEQKWCSNVVSSFTSNSIVVKIFRTMNWPEALDLWRHSLPYMVKQLSSLFRSYHGLQYEQE